MKSKPRILIEKEEVSLTMEKINEAQAVGKTGSDFPKIAKEMKKIGIKTYYFNAITGLRIYESVSGQKFEDSVPGEQIFVTVVVSKEKLQYAIKIHQNGETLFPAFKKQAVEAGVNNWTADFERMVVDYFDAKGNLILSEPISKI